MILRLAVLIQYRSVTDTHTHTDRRTDRHMTTAYTMLSKASHGKNTKINLTALITIYLTQILEVSTKYTTHFISKSKVELQYISFQHVNTDWNSQAKKSNSHISSVTQFVLKMAATFKEHATVALLS